ncbi:MAG: hypothetical protein AAB592_03715 [Patescibacteria group bacterium]
MIRRFFAALIIMFILVVSFPLSLLFAILQTYGNPEMVKNEILPQSYAVVPGLLAQRVAEEQDADDDLKDRLEQTLRESLPQDEYAGLLSTIYDGVRNTLGELANGESVISIREEKKALGNAVKKALMRYPVCTTKGDSSSTCFPSDLPRGELVQKVDEFISLNLPSEMELQNQGQSQMILWASQAIRYRSGIQMAIALFIAVCAGLVALIIFRPRGAVLIWSGVAVFAAAAGMSVMGFILTSFVDLMQKDQPLPGANEAFARFVISFPEAWIWHMVPVLAAVAAVLIAIGIRLRNSATQART